MDTYLPFPCRHLLLEVPVIRLHLPFPSQSPSYTNLLLTPSFPKKVWHLPLVFLLYSKLICIPRGFSFHAEIHTISCLKDPGPLLRAPVMLLCLLLQQTTDDDYILWHIPPLRTAQSQISFNLRLQSLPLQYFVSLSPVFWFFNFISLIVPFLTLSHSHSLPSSGPVRHCLATWTFLPTFCFPHIHLTNH